MMSRISFLVFLLIAAFSLCLPVHATSAIQVEAKGVIDISNWNFEKDGLLKLNAPWEVYWDRYVNPGDFESFKSERRYFDVPGSWEDLHKAHLENGHSGFATFRLVIKTGNKNQSYALSIVDILTAFKIYVNGDLVSSFGQLERTGEPIHRHPMMISRVFSGDTLEIVIHVANFAHSRGGLFHAISIGPPQTVFVKQRKTVGLDMFLFGSILLIGIYHLGNFFFRKKDLASLFFSLLCFLFALRISFMNVRFAILMFPQLTINFSIFVQYVCIYLALPVYAAFMYYLYPNDFSKPILKLIVLISILFTAVIIPFNETVYLVSILLFELFAVVAFIYICFVLIKAIRNERRGAFFILGGFLLVFITTINDILFDQNIISTGFYLPLGMLGYILFQALHLSHRSSLYLSRIEDLSDQLSQVNGTLEQRVKIRTAELKNRNEELKSEIAEHERTAQQLAEAKLIAEEANHAKSEFLANMSHELRTPMHGILGFAKFGEDRVFKADRNTLLDFFKEIRACGDRLLILLNDLLDLSKLESGKITYDFEPNKLTNVVETVLKEFSPMAKEKEIELNFSTPDIDSEGVFDEAKMIQVVRNLISNAIKYSLESSKIDIEIIDQQDYLMFSVADEGVGIPESELTDVFDKFVQSSKTKSNAGGTGLGLPISQKIILDHSGEIWAANNDKGGATFTFLIPKFRKIKKKPGDILVEQQLIGRKDLNNTLQNQ